MKSIRMGFFALFIAALVWGVCPTIISTAQEPEKQKSGSTAETWRQSLPSNAEAPSPVEETPETVASLASREKTQNILLALERSWMDSLKVGDADSLSEILAADFAFASPRIVEGKDRTKYLEYALRDLKLVSYEFDKTTVRLFGKTAIVSGLLKKNATVKGEDRAGNYLVTDVWLNRNGVWRVVSRHESPLK
jgi:ketosteroid isomerase-like protein